MAFNQIPTASVAQLSEDTVLLDVREAEEWSAGRAVGAVHIPMSEITGRVPDLPVGDDVVVVCHVGGRSARVTAWLLRQDYACRNLAGGMVAYAAAGLPLEADGDRTPMVD
jgi:rhodanese-related sulfurtransferase